MLWVHKGYGFRHAVEKSVRTCSGSGILLLFLLQPNLVKRCALVFSCIRMGAGSEHLYMTEDLSVQCWSRQHWLYISTFGTAFGLLYVIGVPIALYYILSNATNWPMVQSIISGCAQEREMASVSTHSAVSDADSKPQSPKKRSLSLSAEQLVGFKGENPNLVRFFSKYAFLFIGYRDKVYYWEIVVLSRKALISLIGVVISTNQRAQCLFGMLVVFISTVAHAKFYPFNEAFFNHLEFISLSTTAATFFCGILTLEGGESGPALPAASVVAGALNLGYISLVFGYGVQFLKEALVEKKYGNNNFKKEKETLAQTSIELTETPSYKGAVAGASTFELQHAHTKKPETINPSEHILDSPSHMVRRQSQNLKRPSQTIRQGVGIVVAIKGYTSPDPLVKMSFERGDRIRVYSNTGAWHKGVLLKKGISNKVLYFPSNFVKPLTQARNSVSVSQKVG